MKSVQSVGIEPWSSKYHIPAMVNVYDILCMYLCKGIDKQRTIRVNSRPRSASVVSDKMKNYVSPYAQQSREGITQSCTVYRVHMIPAC